MYLLVETKPITTDSSIAEYYRLGWGLKEIGRILGVNHKTVRRRLVAQGIPLRPPNNVKRSMWLTERSKESVA